MSPVKTPQETSSPPTSETELNGPTAKASPEPSSTDTAPQDLWAAIRTIIGLQNQAPPLQPVPRHQPLAVSFTQERLWFLNQLDATSSAYNIPFAFQLQGSLDVAALEQSFHALWQRHEALRTTLACPTQHPVQVVTPAPDWTLETVDLQSLSSAEQETQIQHHRHQLAQHPFDLAQGPLLRVVLLRLSDRTAILLLNVHHIVFDGWSEGILWRELAALYEAFAAGHPSPLPELPIQYADFAHWQRQWLQGDFLEALLDYWRGQLGDGLPELPLPTDHPRPSPQTRRSATQTLVLSESLTAALKAMSRQTGATLFATLLAAFKVLLHRYSDQTDLCVCSPVANRNRKELQGLIGYFVNLLILRSDLSGDPSFRALVGRVKQGVTGAYAHQDLPVQQLVSHLNMGSAALSQVMFVLQNTPRQVPQFADVAVSALAIDNGMADFDVFLSLTEVAGVLQGELKYNTDLFEAATIERMLQHFQVILEQVVANPEGPISQLLPLSDEEQQWLQQGRETYQTKPKLKPTRDYVKPRNRLELQLVNIWEKVLGIQPIGVKDNFFELGGESLIAMRLFAQIEQQLGQTLSLAMLLQTPTVEQLAAVLQQQPGKDADALRSLVPLQVGDSKPPLFLIPPGATTVLHYAPLLHYLDSDQSVYGLEYLGMDGKDFPHTCVEDMATHYIKEMQTLQPEGPYFLVGRCFGGIVAFEVAQQLWAQGQQVALLGILDTLRPPGYADYAETPTQSAASPSDKSSASKAQKSANHPPSKKPGYYFSRLTQRLQQGELLSTVSSRLQHKTLNLLDRVHARARKQQFIFPYLQKIIFSSLSQELRIDYTFRAQKKARKDYVAEVYPGKITLFNNSEFAPASRDGWAALAGDGLECRQVPGDHVTMFREPNISVTSGEVMASLRAAQKSVVDPA